MMPLHLILTISSTSLLTLRIAYPSTASQRLTTLREEFQMNTSCEADGNSKSLNQGFHTIFRAEHFQILVLHVRLECVWSGVHL